QQHYTPPTLYTPVTIGPWRFAARTSISSVAGAPEIALHQRCLGFRCWRISSKSLFKHSSHSSRNRTTSGRSPEFDGRKGSIAMIFSLRKVGGGALSLLTSDVLNRATSFVIYAMVARPLGAL